MPVPITCNCGATFSIEEGARNAACPECHAVIEVQAAPVAVRTSGLALASALFAVVLAFTGVGTIIAIVLGVIALAVISQHRGEVAGAGFAIFGIVAGAFFSLLFFLAVARPELFAIDPLAFRDGKKDVDTAGSLQVTRPGYTIARPSRNWGVARGKRKEEVSDAADLVLINVGRREEAYLFVMPEPALGRDVQELGENVLNWYRFDPPPPKNAFEERIRYSNLRVRANRRLPPSGGMERLDVFFDVRITRGIVSDNITFHVRVVRSVKDDRAFVIAGWADQRIFPRVETDIRRALDSFQVRDQ